MSDPMMMSDPKNPQDYPDVAEEIDKASEGTSDEARKLLDDETTDDDGAPLDNPSGG